MKVRFIANVGRGIVYGFTGEWVYGQVYDVDDELGKRLLETGAFEKVEIETAAPLVPVKTAVTVGKKEVEKKTVEGGEIR